MVIRLPWIVFCLYWLYTGFDVRRAQVKEPLGPRLRVMIPLLVGYTLLFRSELGLRFADRRFLPRGQGIWYLGVLLTYLGIAFTLWARHHLGEYWSARITLKVDHKLIRTGPYARVRHPIYAGLVLATFGTALAKGKWSGVLGAVLILGAYLVKARREERLLAGQFGQQFQEHQRRTGMLMPRL